MNNIISEKHNEMYQYKIIEEDIMQRISSGAFSFTKPICTESELMAQYHVSRITVRHALDDLENKKLIYRKRGQGSFVVPNIYEQTQNNTENSSSPVIVSKPIFAFVIPFNVTNTGLKSVLNAATNWLNAHNSMTTVYIAEESGDHRGRNILQQLTTLDVAGVAYYPQTENYHREILDQLMMQGKSVVLMDIPSHSPHLASVVCDNLNGTLNLVEHLVSLGHKKIAFYSGILPSARDSVQDRFSGYLLGLSKVGIKPDPALIHLNQDVNKQRIPPANMDDLKEVVLSFRTAGATAILCEHDVRSYYIIQACQSLGLRVPEDISVCGFDNNEWSTLITGKRLTTVAQDWEKIGIAIAEILYQNMNKPFSLQSTTIIPTSLVIGNTSASPENIDNP